MRIIPPLLVLSLLLTFCSPGLELKKKIHGNIAPKSIVHSGTGLFFAQNMMYCHSITVYNRRYELVTTIPDRIPSSLLNPKKRSGQYRGAPVEAAFSNDGKFAWITNYAMFGDGFDNPGCDTCEEKEHHDISYVYRIDTHSLKIDLAVAVGSVPKYIAASPDNKWVVVANWCSSDVSVIDVGKGKEVRRIKVGRYPRGIAIDTASSRAYVAVMGSYDVAVIRLADFSVSWVRNVGRSPRHLAIDRTNQFLYASLNGEDRIVKVDLSNGSAVRKVFTGEEPRSLALSDDGRFVYVVNYESDTVSKVRCEDMSVLETVKTDHHPIGVAYDPQTRQVWVSCYSGSIMVYQD